jgi:hypothetical protein
MIKISEDLRDIAIEANMWAVLRRGGKVVPGSLREGHNVFTVTGRNLLSKLISWETIAATDIPYTHRRARWIGVGIGSFLEVTTVASLAQPQKATPTNYIVPLQTVEFPSPTSVRFIKEFGTGEITISGAPVNVTEAGLFADVSPGNAGGSEDVGHSGSPTNTILNPEIGTNSPIAYKSFEGLTKTIDFTLEFRWEFRF